MPTAINNSTRFFSVVGVPYIAEQHSDDRCDDVELPPVYRPALSAMLPRPCTSVFWLQDE